MYFVDHVHVNIFNANKNSKAGYGGNNKNEGFCVVHEGKVRGCGRVNPLFLTVS